MTAARVIVTADTPDWAEIAGRTMSGYATSVIGCDAEAASSECSTPETPDGRPGVSVLLFAFSRDALEKALVNRVGQCVMTCPTTACYNGLPPGREDHQHRRQPPLLRRRLADHQAARGPAVLADSGDGRRVHLRGGLRHDQGRGGRATSDPAGDRPGGGCWPRPRRPSRAMRRCRDVILPFPGGIVRSGIKVGSKYKKLRASTNTAFAPTLRGAGPVRACRPRSSCVYEIVIDGLSLEAVERATAAGVRRQGAARESSRSRRGTMAASSVRSTSACTTFWDGFAERHARVEYSSVLGELL